MPFTNHALATIGVMIPPPHTSQLAPHTLEHPIPPSKVELVMEEDFGQVCNVLLKDATCYSNIFMQEQQLVDF